MPDSKYAGIPAKVLDALAIKLTFRTAGYALNACQPALRYWQVIYREAPLKVAVEVLREFARQPDGKLPRSKIDVRWWVRDLIYLEEHLLGYLGMSEPRTWKEYERALKTVLLFKFDHKTFHAFGGRLTSY